MSKDFRPLPRRPEPAVLPLTDLQQNLVKLVTEYETQANELMSKVESGLLSEHDANWQGQLFLPCVDNVDALEQYAPCYLANATALEAERSLDVKNHKDYVKSLAAYHYSQELVKLEKEGVRPTEARINAIVDAMPAIQEARGALAEAEAELVRVQGAVKSIQAVIAVIPGIQGKRNRTLD